MFKTIVIVGSPNVGKSTLFNRFIHSRLSIISDVNGTTRDRLYAKVSFLDRDFYVVDTGGLDFSLKQPSNLQKQIHEQVFFAIEEADLILFMVDVKIGLTINDQLIADLIRQKCKKPVILVINKVDNKQKELEVYDFFKLGFENVILISSEHNIGIDILKSKIVQKISPTTAISPKENNSNCIAFSIIGRPNVGKSTLLNAIIQKKRVIVSDIEGTTRDSVDVEFQHKNQNYVVIDTGGLKKRGKTTKNIDKYSKLRTLRAIERSDIVLLVIDVSVGLLEQDKHIASYVCDNKKSVIILVNKCDKVKVDILKFTKEIRQKIKFLSYSNIVFISALKNKNIEMIFDEIKKTYFNFYKKIDISLLKKNIIDNMQMNEIPTYHGGKLEIFDIEQSSQNATTFNVLVNNPKFVHFSFARFIENNIRSIFAFENTTLTVNFKKISNKKNNS